MEQHVLEPLGGPCILAIDETDAIFQTTFSQDFFSMLRSWHNRRADPIRRSWKKLDIILSTSTEPQFFIDRPHESPFNVGVTLQARGLSTRSRSASSTRSIRGRSRRGDVERLYRLVRGHPYPHAQGAVHGGRQHADVQRRRALRPRPGRRADRSAITCATTCCGCSGRQDLIPALRQVVDGRTLNDELAIYRLQALGLVRRDGHKVAPRCELYGEYFRERLRSDA